MERSEIRGRSVEIAIPDCAALHPGYGTPPLCRQLLQQVAHKAA